MCRITPLPSAIYSISSISDAMIEGHHGGDHYGDSPLILQIGWNQEKGRPRGRPSVTPAAQGLRMRRKKLTIHESCRTANFYATARDCVALDFQLFGGNTAGQ